MYSYDPINLHFQSNFALVFHSALRTSVIQMKIMLSTSAALISINYKNDSSRHSHFLNKAKGGRAIAMPFPKITNGLSYKIYKRREIHIS